MKEKEAEVVDEVKQQKKNTKNTDDAATILMMEFWTNSYLMNVLSNSQQLPGQILVLTAHVLLSRK